MNDTNEMQYVDPEEDPNIDISILPEPFLNATGREVTAQAIEALDILSTGEIPPHFLNERQGPGGKKIKYLKHIVVTKILNRALQWLWDFRADPNIHIGRDGSVAVVCEMVVHVPIRDARGEILRDRDGRPIYHDRTVREIGSFEAYPAKTRVRDESVPIGPGGEVTMKEIVLRDDDGNIVFTMNEADRIASATSRGLARCAMRMFNLGIDLMEPGESAPMTYDTARRLLLEFGQKKWGLTEEQVMKVLRDNKFSRTTLITEFGQAWALIREAGEALVPNL